MQTVSLQLHLIGFNWIHLIHLIKQIKYKIRKTRVGPVIASTAKRYISQCFARRLVKFFLSFKILKMT